MDQAILAHDAAGQCFSLTIITIDDLNDFLTGIIHWADCRSVRSGE